MRCKIVGWKLWVCGGLLLLGALLGELAGTGEGQALAKEYAEPVME